MPLYTPDEYVLYCGDEPAQVFGAPDPDHLTLIDPHGTVFTVEADDVTRDPTMTAAEYQQIHDG